MTLGLSVGYISVTLIRSTIIIYSDPSQKQREKSETQTKSDPGCTNNSIGFHTSNPGVKIYLGA